MSSYIYNINIKNYNEINNIKNNLDNISQIVNNLNEKIIQINNDIIGNDRYFTGITYLPLFNKNPYLRFIWDRNDISTMTLEFIDQSGNIRTNALNIISNIADDIDINSSHSSGVSYKEILLFDIFEDYNTQISDPERIFIKTTFTGYGTLIMVLKITEPMSIRAISTTFSNIFLINDIILDSIILQNYNYPQINYISGVENLGIIHNDVTDSIYLIYVNNTYAYYCIEGRSQRNSIETWGIYELDLSSMIYTKIYDDIINSVSYYKNNIYFVKSYFFENMDSGIERSELYISNTDYSNQRLLVNSIELDKDLPLMNIFYDSRKTQNSVFIVNYVNWFNETQFLSFFASNATYSQIGVDYINKTYNLDRKNGDSIILDVLILLSDPLGVIQMINLNFFNFPKFSKIWKYTENETIEQNIIGYTPPSDVFWTAGYVYERDNEERILLSGQNSGSILLECKIENNNTLLYRRHKVLAEPNDSNGAIQIYKTFGTIINNSKLLMGGKSATILYDLDSGEIEMMKPFIDKPEYFGYNWAGGFLAEDGYIYNLRANILLKINVSVFENSELKTNMYKIEKDGPEYINNNILPNLKNTTIDVPVIGAGVGDLLLKRLGDINNLPNNIIKKI